MYRIDDVLSEKRRKLSSVRVKETIKRVNVRQPAIDIGEKNTLSIDLGIKENTTTDLDFPVFKNMKYETVTCFEVIEHLRNPLLFLTEVKKLLSPTGIFYLTTPVRWWIGKGKYHFHEYNKVELLNILRNAGFNDIELERIRAYNFKPTGIRPVIRLLRDVILGQCFFVKAR